MKGCICHGLPEYQCPNQYCPDGFSHMYSDIVEEWNNIANKWDVYRLCIRCDKRIQYVSLKTGCIMDKDKKHTYKRSSHINNHGVLIDEVACIKCKSSMGYSHDHPGYHEWCGKINIIIKDNYSID